MAEDGALECPALCDAARFPAGASHPDWFILHEQKAEHSKPTVLPAHRLAGEPGTPVRFTFRTVPRDSNPDTRALNAVPLPLG